MSDRAATTVTDARVALVTAPSPDAAERLVRTLVDERIVACGNIMPGLTSIYHWRGAVERETEVLVVLKTTAAAVPRLLTRVPELHPYEVPELLVLTVVAGHGPYVAWLHDNVGDTDEG